MSSAEKKKKEQSLKDAMAIEPVPTSDVQGDDSNTSFSITSDSQGTMDFLNGQYYVSVSEDSQSGEATSLVNRKT